ncbi:MAG: tRNA lysidine(34) synthetase TilS [Legionellaceae bacterium]|nr:tRNA lysidine(34) synthetase TilS [Legionellaceae bacterium]
MNTNHMIKKTLETFLNNLTASTTVVVGYSGGVDSHVLLHALAKLREAVSGLRLSAIHVNHHLQKEADVWVTHCKRVGEQLNVPIQLVDVNVNPTKGESVEAAAREARYHVFAKHLPENAYLVTAHHQDDQAETVLLQLLRGAGVKGLSAMPAIMPFSQGFLARPLLSVSQEALVEYAKQQSLSWVDDQSNQNLQYQRNFLRAKVMPLLKQVRPAAVEAMSRSAQHCASASELLETLAAEDLQQVKLDGKRLSAKKLKAFLPNRQANVMRYWLQLQGCVLPSTVKMQHILQDLIASRYDAKPEICWGGVKLQRLKDEILLKENGPGS